MSRLLLAAAVVAAGLLATSPALADSPPKTKPKIVISGDPPKKLQIRDQKKGKGRVAHTGDQLEVRYVLVTWSDRKQKDGNFGRDPFAFTLGAGMVIRGWDKGLVGMREGGRRKLVVPPSLGYGKRGAPPAIKGDETLVFVVDLLRVRSA